MTNIKNNTAKYSARACISALFTMVLVSGCASNIKQLPEQANVSLPEKWEVEIKQRNATDKTVVADEQVDVANDVVNGWLNSFSDDELAKYVQIALENNPDLLSSAAQLKSAIEQVTINGARLWPNISAKLSKNRIDNDTDGVTTEIRTVSGTLDISWEADVWGKLSQRKKSAAYSAQAQAELFKAAELSLVANVSRAWFNLVANKLQLDLAHQRLESFQRTAGLIDENYKRGLRSALDVYLSRTDVQLQISALADTQFNYVQSLRTFKTLLGEYPDSALEFSSKLPALSGMVPAGLPAQLLTRRPDLKASQLQYKAQIATAKAANRDRYPSISFSGSIGDSRESFNRLFENDNMILTLLGGITQPVFQAGALRSLEDQALYQAETAYANLLKTTLTAYQEVEDSLSRETSLFDQHSATKQAVGFAQSGLDLALDRYQSGIENYTTVLESQRRLFDSMRSEINLRNALLQNRIGIHLALGGDFSDIPNREPTESLPTITPSANTSTNK